MSEIKQEWLKEARQAAFLVATDDDVSTMLRPQTTARAILEAVAPLIRADALREAAKVAGWAHMVPLDGGSPTEDERLVAEAAESHILALIDAPKNP